MSELKPASGGQAPSPLKSTSGGVKPSLRRAGGPGSKREPEARAGYGKAAAGLPHSKRTDLPGRKHRYAETAKDRPLLKAEARIGVRRYSHRVAWD